MRKMFWGVLLMVAYLRVSLGRGTVNLLPDFAGTLLILSGIRELNGESPALERARTMLIVATAVMAVSWVNALAGIDIPVVSPAVNIAVTCVKIYVLYRLADGVRELERCRETDLRSGPLMASWKLYCACVVLYQICVLVGFFTELGFVILPLWVALGAYIAYLIYFYKAGTAYAQSVPPAMKIAEGNTYDP